MVAAGIRQGGLWGYEVVTLGPEHAYLILVLIVQYGPTVPCLAVNSPVSSIC